MGFKSGQSLGKINKDTSEYTAITPLKEPLKPDLSRNNKKLSSKLGIGIEKHEKRKRDSQIQRIKLQAAKQAKLAEQFAENSRRSHEVAMWWNDLKKVKKVVRIWIFE